MNLYLKPSIVCKADGSEMIELQSISNEYIDTLIETLSVLKSMSLDDVLNIIRMSDSENKAVCKLVESFGITEKQAKYIVNIPINKATIVFNPQNVDEYIEWLSKLRQLLFTRPQEWTF